MTKLLATCSAQPTFEEARCEGRPIKVEFRGELRPDQAPAVQALAACDIGVLVAPPAFGKTVAAANLIACRKVSTLVLVEKVTLLEQWKERLEQFLDIDEELPELLTPTGRKSRKNRSIIGQIGGGKRLPSGVVDIALVPALFEKGDLPGEKRVAALVGSYGMVICDECHHVSAFSFEKVMRAVKAHYVHGLTGTPKRSDGLQSIAFMQCRPVRYQAGRGAVGEEAPLARVMVPRFTKTRLDDVDQENFTQLVDGLCVDEARNGLIVRDVARVLDGGGTALVLTRRVEHAARLEKGFASQGYETMLLVGSDPQRIKREKLRMLGQFASGKPFAIVATGSYVGEGFDDDRLDALFMAGPVSWSGLVAQYVGRLHRRREGKNEVVVYDYVDVNVRMLDRMYRKRLKEYAAQGYELRPAGVEGDVRGEFVTPESYLERFELDVTKAAKTLVVTSSEVLKRRVELLVPCLEAAVARGVDVQATLPDPEEAKPKKVQAIADAAALLKQVGARVSFREACPNLVVADSATVWYGGIAPFAYPRADDQVLRFISGEVARELLGLFGSE
ncbi:DEAD/DEAH box helicase family protein [Gordonibacter urolithinfaciens]|uniref:DEAD/DEAH box helicase family protein n=1 Tax=Gordonibacter urolithinfaciens TaxID=1335613 RepID=UPI0034A9A234